MKCVWCGFMETKNRRWKVCKRCYSWLRSNAIIDTSPGHYSFNKLPQDKRIAKIVVRFGDGIKNSMRELMEGIEGTTLDSIGKQYGVTREYIRQIFKLFHGESYSNVVKKKVEFNERMRIESKTMSCIHDPRNKVASYKNHNSSQFKGAESELIVFNKCRELGMNVSPSKTTKIDLIINGWVCDVKSRGTIPKLGKHNKRAYYNCNMSEKQRELCDFIIFHVIPMNEFYIFPRDYFNERGSALFVPANASAYKSRNCKNALDDKIFQYKEAWHLLENDKHVPSGCNK